MRIAGYTWRRSRARAGLVGLLLGMAALIVLAIAGTVGFLDVSSTSGLRDAVAASPPAAQVLQVQTRQAEDPAAQDAQARALIADRLPADAQISTTTRTTPLPLADSEDRAVLGVDDAIADHATLGSGVWPSAPEQVALHAGAADALGLALGDTVTVTAEDTSTDLEIVGLWLPLDADDPHWAGDPMLASGVDPLNEASYGPFVVTAEALEPLDVAPFAQWTVTPGPELTPDDLDGWLDGLPQLEPALDDAGLTVRGVTTSGTLATTLADAQESLASVRASSMIPLLVVALVSLVALWQITRLLAATRERETLVLLSRGAAPAQLVRVGAAEAAAVALGALLGGVAVALAFAGRPGYQLPTTAALALAVVLAVVVVMVTATARAAATGLHPEGESGRATAALTGAALVLVLGLAAFSLWRFTRNGTPLVPGTQRVDVVAVAGPALGLIAVALLAVAAAGPLSRALAAAGARRPGFSPVTELRQSSRRITVNAVPVVLVVLAAAIATVASGYAGTWQALRDASGQVSLGADVRVAVVGGLVDTRPAGVAEVSADAGGAPAAGVLQTSLRYDETAGQLTALPMSQLGVSSAPPALLDPAAAALTPATDPLPGIDLPADTGELALDVKASAVGDVNDSRRREVSLAVWLSDGTEMIRLETGSLTLEASDTYGFDQEAQESIVVPNPDKGRPVEETFALDVPAGSWRVVAVDSVMSASYQATDWTIEIGGLRADGADLLGGVDPWDPNIRPMPGSDGSGYVSTGSLAFTGSYAGEMSTGPAPVLFPTTLQRFMPASDADLRVPVVTTPGWNDQIRPDGTTVFVGPNELTVAQVGTIAVVPGNPDRAAALTDLPTLQNVLLRSADGLPGITQIWVDAGDRAPHDVADQLRVALGPSADVTATGEGVTDAVAAPARIVYWIAAVCALLLALPAIAAVALTQATSRRGEVVVLRAVGVGAVQQGRSRTRELLGLELGAVLAGVVAGAALCALIMVPLIRSTTPQVSSAVPLGVTYDWLPGAALVAAVLLTVAAVALWYGARVRAQARDTTWREEIR